MRGARPVRARLASVGVALIGVVLVAAACGGPSTPVPSGAIQTGPSPSESPTGPVGSAEPTVAPSEPPATEAPSTPGATAEGSALPSGSVAPSVDSMTVQRVADCASDNGTGQVGYIEIGWTASGTSGVRISIDPPSPDVAYGYGFADYQESAGSAEVPFSCDPPNHDAKGDFHLYVVTTLHDKGYFFYRYAKVYEAAAPTP